LAKFLYEQVILELALAVVSMAILERLATGIVAALLSTIFHTGVVIKRHVAIMVQAHFFVKCVV